MTVSPLPPAPWMPGRHELPEDELARRHRLVVGLLAMHVPAVVVVGLVAGYGLGHAAAEALPLAALAVLAARAPGRTMRLMAASVGLLVASAVLVHLTGGLPEAHFHVFLVVAVVAAYEDLRVFVVALAFVALHHVALGALQPDWVFASEAARAAPVGWALVHAGYVLAVAGVMAYLWSTRDAARDREVAMRIELDERAFRARQALELNDSVVQGLATARYAMELGEDALARAAMDQTLEAARALISDLMPEGRTPDLVRERPAMSVCLPAAVGAGPPVGDLARKEAA